MTRSSGRSATSGSRLFISMRRAASWCQPLQVRSPPRGARIVGASVVSPRKFGKVIQHLLEQLGNVEPFGVNGVGGNHVELFDGQASGVVLQQVIDERDSLFGVLGVFGYEPTCPHPGRRRDAGAPYGREREESNFKLLNSLDDL